MDTNSHIPSRLLFSLSLELTVIVQNDVPVLGWWVHNEQVRTSFVYSVISQQIPKFQTWQNITLPQHTEPPSLQQQREARPPPSCRQV